MSDWKNPHPTWIVGHRGSPRRARENTIDSLDAAEQSGCEAVEFDLRQTRDGEAVLFHDEEIVLGTQRIPIRTFTTREIERCSSRPSSGRTGFRSSRTSSTVTATRSATSSKSRRPRRRSSP